MPEDKDTLKLDQIIQGDCLGVMKTMSDKCVDLVLTDPPYNTKNIGPNKRVYSLGQMQLPPKEYAKFCFDWFKEARRIGKVVVFTPGIANITNYPQPDWVIAWHKPASVSFNRMGGFNAWEPIFIYGKPAKGKHLGQDYILCNTLNFTKGVEKDHPCPKPPKLWGKLMDIFSNEGDVVFDPMMGSGTTAYVAVQLKRRWGGIELNPEYIKIAEKRLKQKPLL